MAEPWIRVHAILIDKPVIARAVDALIVSEHTAVGLLVTFWGAVARNVVGGSLVGVTDSQIENWARWRGKRGRFAAFIREHHLDADGRVREWEEYAGALEARRATERTRLRNKRHGVAQREANKPPTDAQQNASVATRAPERNGTERESSTTPTTKPSRRKPRVEGAGTDAPQATWLTPACTAWEAKYGAGSFAGVAGQAAKALAPLRTAGHTDAELGEHLAIYLERTEPRFVSLTRFAQTFAEWVQHSLVDEHGFLNERGLAAMRSE
jgi:hypothetical protein